MDKYFNDTESHGKCCLLLQENFTRFHYTVYFRNRMCRSYQIYLDFQSHKLSADISPIVSVFALDKKNAWNHIRLSFSWFSYPGWGNKRLISLGSFQELWMPAMTYLALTHRLLVISGDNFWNVQSRCRSITQSIIRRSCCI